MLVKLYQTIQKECPGSFYMKRKKIDLRKLAGLDGRRVGVEDGYMYIYG